MGPAFAWRHEVHAVVPMTFSLTTGVTGNGDLKYTSVIYTGPDVSPCSQTSVGSNSVFQVLKTFIDFNVIEGGGSPVDKLTMEYDPGYPNFTFTMTCPESPKVELKQDRWRTEYYDHLHSADRSGGGFIARDWSPAGEAIYARRMYQNNNQFANESTIFTLKHTPQ
jgi:hypothetical protein